MEFKKPFTKYENEPSPSGDKIQMEHSEHISKEGRRTLELNRPVAIYEKIQASKESCEIENILRRAAEGDTSVLNIVNGQYLDIVGAPASLAEAQQFVIKAKNDFENLPKEIRAKFENNAEMYVAQYGTDEWQEKTGLKAKLEADKAAKEAEKTFRKNAEKAFEKLAKEGSVTNE